MALNNKLAQKRLLIIGGSSGIGLATAQQATAAGAQTIVAGRSESKLRDAVASISGDVTAYPVDLTDDASVKSLFEKVGALDYLVLTGPAPTFGHFLELDTEQVHQEFEGKFWGQYRAVKYAAPRLEKTGAIVLMSGAYSARPVPGATSLAAVQAGVEGLARGLAIDLAPIRVNVISPGLLIRQLFTMFSLMRLPVKLSMMSKREYFQLDVLVHQRTSLNQFCICLPIDTQRAARFSLTEAIAFDKDCLFLSKAFHL